jgi:hypothetical protein
VGAGLALLALAAISTLYGCGDTKKTSSKAEYVAKANKVCAALQAEMRALALRRAPIPVLQREAIAIKDKANAKLRAIPLPAAAAIPSEWLHYREQAVTNGKRLNEAKAGTPARQVAERDYFQATLNARRVALAYGLSSCDKFAS